MTGSAKVAVNLSWCIPGKVGGSEEYLCRQLLGLDTTFDTTLFVPRGFAEAHPELVARFPMVSARGDGRSRARRVASESGWLYRRTADFDLVHHGGGTIPPVRRSPTLLTIHDLQYREFPGYFRPHKLAYLRFTMPRSAKRATAIAVPTEFVKNTVHDAYGIDPARIHVVPHGIEPSLGSNATPIDELRSRYRLGSEPFVVFPAMTHPHKGHGFLLDVMERSWIDQGVRLILIGGAGSVEADVARRLASGRLATHVSRLGRVPSEDRDGFLKAALAMVFPSEYEGFGAPVIEAMTLGTPVISSDRACLPEVVGDAGLVVPLTTEGWASALDDLDRRRSDLVARGFERSRMFTTVVSGSALTSAYRSVLG
jgi:glycosyltransferase involved in cell wall biosynthesis